MHHLKLCKGLSYCGAGGAVKATRQQPDIYIEDQFMADTLVSSGFFIRVDEEDAPTDVPNGDVTPPVFDVEALAQLNLKELTSYAKKNNISLKGVPSTKEDVLEAICVANGGSYIMLDLMRE